MNNYCIMRTEKIKDWNATAGSGAHNLRTGNYGNNVDEKKSVKNRYIIAPENNDLNQHIRNRFEECGITPKYYGKHHKNNSVLAIEVFMGVSNGVFDKRPEKDLDKWIELNTKYLKDKYGEENIASLALHYDETTPHLQAHIIPIVHDEKKDEFKLSAKHFIGGQKYEMQKEQTEYAKRFEKFGLERGHENSKDRHISQKQYRRVINRLNKSLDVKYIKVEKPSLLSSYKNYQRDLQKKVDSLADQALAYKMRAELAEEKVNSKAYSENKRLKQEKADLIESGEKLSDRVYDLENKNEELEKQNESLKAENKEYRMELKRYGRKQEKKKGLSHP